MILSSRFWVAFQIGLVKGFKIVATIYYTPATYTDLVTERSPSLVTMIGSKADSSQSLREWYRLSIDLLLNKNINSLFLNY